MTIMAGNITSIALSASEVLYRASRSLPAHMQPTRAFKRLRAPIAAIYSARNEICRVERAYLQSIYTIIARVYSRSLHIAEQFFSETLFTRPKSVKHHT